MKASSKPRKSFEPDQVFVPDDGNFKDGDLIKITGVGRLPTGEYIRNCKPGEEVVMIARVEKLPAGVEIKVSPFTGTPPSKRNIKGVADRIDADVYARFLAQKPGKPPVRLGDNTPYAPVDWVMQ
jgi:hypothetical protein